MANPILVSDLPMVVTPQELYGTDKQYGTSDGAMSAGYGMAAPVASGGGRAGGYGNLSGTDAQYFGVSKWSIRSSPPDGTRRLFVQPQRKVRKVMLPDGTSPGAAARIPGDAMGSATPQGEGATGGDSGDNFKTTPAEVSTTSLHDSKDREELAQLVRVRDRVMEMVAADFPISEVDKIGMQAPAQPVVEEHSLGYQPASLEEASQQSPTTEATMGVDPVHPSQDSSVVVKVKLLEGRMELPGLKPRPV